MIRSLQALLMVAVVAASFSINETANAQVGFGNYSLAAANAFFPNYYVDQRPPYFAQFPPVYYKHPIIARHYGESPFPYPACGCACSTTVEEITPAMMRNPFVKPSSEESTDAKEASMSGTSAAPQPLIIINPYVVRPDRSASTQGDRSAHTVYPAATFASRH